MPDAQSATLERELDELLEQEWFEPPEDFVRQALITDESEHEAAERDPEGWWAKQAEALHWFKRWDTVLDDGDAPFYKWFVGGEINASYNCLDRHIEAGLGDRVAFHWRGEEGEERDVTYADLLRDVQKFANALKDRGVGRGDVVGIYLPMIPEVVVAMLACARIGAPHNVVFGGFSAGSVGERMEVSNAKALVTVDGARRKGKTAPIKQQVDEVIDEMGVDSIETIFVVQHTKAECELRRRPRHLVPRGARRGGGRVRGRGARRRAPAVHPVLVGLDGQAQGHPAQDGRLPHAGGVDAEVRLRPQARVRRVLVLGRRRLGHRHSYIVYGPLMNAATSVMYEGAPDYPAKDIWWELCERYGVTIFYTAPTAIRACMKWGAELAERHDLSSLRLLGTVGEPINPKAWLWYWKVVGGGRCPVVDTWWQTETGAIMITTLPGAQPSKPGSAGNPLPGIRAGGRRRRWQRGRARRAGAADADAALAGDAANALRRRRPLRRDVLRALRQRHLPRGRRLAQGRGRLHLGHRSRRRRRQHLGPPDVHGRDRVRSRVARQGRRVRGDRTGRRGTPGRR
jgi:acetyl-CoA synthetase